MRVGIEIPKEFENHFNTDRFTDAFNRAEADINHAIDSNDVGLLGNYEKETFIMLREAFKDALVLPDDLGDFSDGYHTFNQLYHQRAILFATIVNQNKEISWKSHKHSDGEDCFGGGWFIVGIDTPEGTYTYHYEDSYWDLFKCEELPVGKEWDGHTEMDVTRLLSLEEN